MSLQLGKLGAGLMQWGTTDIDDKVVNPKGNLAEDEVRNIWRTCRERQIVFFDTAEGKKAYGLEMSPSCYLIFFVMKEQNISSKCYPNAFCNILIQI